MDAQERPKVLVFDNTFLSSKYERKIRDGITQARWRPRVFTFSDYREAVEDVDESLSALILCIGGIYRSAEENGLKLIQASNALEIPRAFITEKRPAGQLIRDRTLDIYIPKDEYMGISVAVASWLNGVERIT